MGTVEDVRLLPINNTDEKVGHQRLQVLETEAEREPVTDGTRKAKHAMYASHALSTWGERAWEFAVGLILLELYPTSLLYVSIFGLLDAAVVVLFGAAVGAYVDRTPRLQAATRMYMLQNSMVAASATAALTMLWNPARSGSLFWAVLGAAMITGAVSSLGSLGSTLSVEREWTKALCGGEAEELARLNAGMKRIDLICLIASPIAVGLLMTAGGPSHGTTLAALAIMAWNLVAWAPECALLRAAQRWSPALREHKDEVHEVHTPLQFGKTPQDRSHHVRIQPLQDDSGGPSTPQEDAAAGCDPEIHPLTALPSDDAFTHRPAHPSPHDPPAAQAGPTESHLNTQWSNSSRPRQPAPEGSVLGGAAAREGGRRSCLQRHWDGWGLYLGQRVAPAALALALLYLTVMSFGTLMTAYLKWRGMAEAELSVYRGFGALSGVLSTLCFPALQRTVGLVRTGAGAIWGQLLCLLCAIAPALASFTGVNVGDRLVLGALVWGLVLSRFWLWTFDLAVNQLIQESVEHSKLGSVNGVQGSLQSLCQMLAYVAGAVVWQPERFALLMAASCTVVAAAAALYTTFAMLPVSGRKATFLLPI